MVGMADGYAQASGRPTLVNLHTAPGVGNAMGALFNARENKSPLVVTAGQQVRAMATIEAIAHQPRRDHAAAAGHQVELRAAPRRRTCRAALARATHLAALPPRGPVFVSIPMDDWAAEADERRVAAGDRPQRRGPHGSRPRGARATSRSGLSGRRTRC